jgi:hypothetical protein
MQTLLCFYRRAARFFKTPSDLLANAGQTKLL